jgi:glycosyltransferase involved in cell wall biosynthesis
MMPEVAFSCLFKRPSIVVIHDIIPLIIDERRKSFNLYFKLMMKIAIKADHLIAVSKSTKRDLINILKVPEDKISIIYEGVDHKKFYPEKKEKKNKNFVIGYMGGLGKRKNVDYILDIAEKFKGNTKILFKIAGNGPELDRLINLKKERNLKNVEFLGFIPEGRLNNFYNSLNLFVFPSYYEGFGLPVIEAMACGVPVMASNTSSLAEIAEDAGILIDPKKPEDAINQIKDIMKSPKLQKKLQKKGIERAKEFKWDKTASETFKTYKKFK